MSWNNVNNNNLNDIKPVLDAFNTKPVTTNNGWTYVAGVGTYGNGPSSHYTYTPNGQLDHYSVYNGLKKIENHKL